MTINSLDSLIFFLSKLPGLGSKSAKRIALFLIQNKSQMSKFADLLSQVSEEIIFCQECFNVDTSNPCKICTNSSRDIETMCIVENIADLWALEKSGMYKGTYHVLGGALSALNGVSINDLNIGNIKDRILKNSIKEVIIATSSSLDGETTGHYITKLLEGLDIVISRLANGIPVGADLDYMDEGTLSLALKFRHKF